jgi:hypothetical protein
MPVRKENPDLSQEALRAVESVTDSDPVNGEDLLGSEDLKRQLREARERVLGSKPVRKKSVQKP